MYILSRTPAMIFTFVAGHHRLSKYTSILHLNIVLGRNLQQHVKVLYVRIVLKKFRARTTFQMDQI